jgi:hypothetical protein
VETGLGVGFGVGLGATFLTGAGLGSGAFFNIFGFGGSFLTMGLGLGVGLGAGGSGSGGGGSGVTLGSGSGVTTGSGSGVTSGSGGGGGSSTGCGRSCCGVSMGGGAMTISKRYSSGFSFLGRARKPAQSRKMRWSDSAMVRALVGFPFSVSSLMVPSSSLFACAEADFGEFLGFHKIYDFDDFFVAYTAVAPDVDGRGFGLCRQIHDVAFECVEVDGVFIPEVVAAFVYGDGAEFDFRILRGGWAVLLGKVYFYALLHDGGGNHEDDEQCEGEVEQRGDVDLGHLAELFFPAKFPVPCFPADAGGDAAFWFACAFFGHGAALSFPLGF